MPYQFSDPKINQEWESFQDKIAPAFVEIEKFCELTPEDNTGLLKHMLFDYAHFQNYLSFNFRCALRFYRIALAEQWALTEEFKGTEERKIRSMVEAACVDAEAVMVQFDKLAKGLQSSQTAIQTAINLEKPLMTNREG
jgi:hypothetical protein